MFQILSTCAILVLTAACGMPIGYSAVLLPQLSLSSQDLANNTAELVIDIEMSSWIGELNKPNNHKSFRFNQMSFHMILQPVFIVWRCPSAHSCRGPWPITWVDEQPFWCLYCPSSSVGPLWPWHNRIQCYLPGVSCAALPPASLEGRHR